MTRIYFVVLLFLLSFSQQSWAFDAIGGNITWTCTGTGRFVFELNLYRDCTGDDLSGNVQKIRVWNHPTVNEIPVTFSSRMTLAPTCTAAAGSSPLICGVGGGNGAVETITYVSDPLDLNGVPPPEGWVFTFETNARKAGISNLTNSELAGMTLVSTIYEIAATQSNCIDFAPRLLNEPLFLICSGADYNFLPAFSDADLDSLSIKFGTPWKNFPTGFYEAGVVPEPAAFAANFNSNSPTPSTSSNSSNIPSSLNVNYGDLNFTSFETGEYVMKLVVQSYRNGRLNAEVEYEFLVHVQACDFANNPPDVQGPFGGLFELEVAPNTPVNFTINSTDLEFRQDNSPQNNHLTAAGLMFGTDFTNAGAGCPILPCATLSPKPEVVGQQGSSIDFSWTPSCDHLRNLHGNEFESVAYDFVFAFQDDVCPLPKKTFKRIRITVKTDVSIEAARIECLKVLPNGDLTLTWKEVSDPLNDFVRYELHEVQQGLMASFNNITTTSTTFPPAGSGNYFIKTISGTPCPVAISSDTVRVISLDVINSAAEGIAKLKWNSPYYTDEGHSGTYQILREYPAGLWTEVGQTSFGFTQFFDTIDICSADINYLIFFSEYSCPHVSTIDGDFFTDETAPTNKPIISYVSIDTLSGSPVLFWEKARDKDTYGYIVYFGNQSTEIDTAVGISTTNYTYTQTADVDSVSFSIAAIDSCLTPGKTSPESIRHRSVYLSSSYNLCAKTVELNWTAYVGWDFVKNYRVFAQIDAGPWQDLGTTKNLNYEIEVDELKTYRFVVEAMDSLSANTSFSNSTYIFTTAPSKPTVNYTRVATVDGNEIVVKHLLGKVSGVTGLQLERLDEGTGDFEVIGEFDYSQNSLSYTDDDVKPDEKPYTYQVRLIDSCGFPSLRSNQVTTMHLTVQENQLLNSNYLSWTPYSNYAGGVLKYNVYRGIEGVFGSLPKITLTPDKTFYTDTLFPDISYNGKICYYVEAVEAMNVHGFREISRSNEVCMVVEPLVYIPNTFSPNGDQINDIFEPIVYQLDLNFYELSILNRWGELIFQSHDKNLGWDGNQRGGDTCTDGIYQYVVKLKDGNDQELIRRGFVNLSR